MYSTQVIGFYVAIVVGCCAANGLCQDQANSSSGDEISVQFRSELQRVAGICDRIGLTREAAITRNWFVEQYAGRQFVFLPRGSDSNILPYKPNADVKNWYGAFRKVRNAYADKLYEQAKEALDEHKPTLAFQMLHAVLRENQDHAAARKALAYIVSSLPRTAIVKTMKFAHDRFGWLPRKHWRIETEYFQISTNHSPKEAGELGRRLEQLHIAWRQLFFSHWSDEDALAHWIENGAPKRLKRGRFQVVLFRDRAEYQAAMARFHPGSGETEGMYLDKMRQVWLYAADDVVARETALHEVTHQLFHETVEPAREVGDSDNFWIIEGIAMYMQSMAAREDFATIGGFDARRLQYARYWYKNKRFYLPLADLVSLGREPLQKHEDIQRLYTQSAGLTHFLMTHDGGRYRDAVIDYLRLVYAGAQELDSLEKLAEVDFAVLDQQYESSLAVTDDHLLKRLNPPEFVTMLMLGGTSVTDKGLDGLADYTHLTMLDVSATRVTDDGLASLVKLKNLEDLWLTQSLVTDRGLEHLRGLKKLVRLEVEATKITPQGMATLKRSLPKLE